MTTRERIQNAADSEWFMTLKSIKPPLPLQSYQLNKNFIESEFQKFTSNPSRNPARQSLTVDGDQIVYAVRQLSELRTKILQEEINKSILTAYIRKIDVMLQELRILDCTHQEDWVGFKQANQERFGAVDEDIVSDLFYKLHTKYHKLFPRTAPSEYLDSLRSKIASSSSLEDARTLLRYQLGEVDDYRRYTAGEMTQLWNTALKDIAPDWQVIADDTVIHIKVNNRRRTILIPDKGYYWGRKMRELFVHEIGTHVARREQGKKSRLQLLGIGLDNYQTAEEGFALMQEQIVSGVFNDFGGLDKYVAIAIAKGFLDGFERDFKDTFAHLREYFLMRKMLRHNESDANRIATYRAWNMTWRFFRGGDPSLPGCCYMKDKIYREGNIKMWQLYIEDRDAFKNVYAGKFDPSDSFHRSLAEEFNPQG